MSSDEIISPAETFKALTRIEAKQDTMLENQRKMITEHDAFEERITRVEQRQNKWAGGLAAFITILAFIGPALRERFFG